MDFAYSQEQQMLAESLGRVVKEDWSFEKRRQRQQNNELDGNSWNTLAELGVLGLSVPAEYDGFGESACPARLFVPEFWPTAITKRSSSNT